MIKLTGLWVNQTKDGISYMSGPLSSGVRLLVFKNKHKKKDTDPDYTACLAENAPKTKQEQGNGDKDSGLPF